MDIQHSLNHLKSYLFFCFARILAFHCSYFDLFDFLDVFLASCKQKRGRVALHSINTHPPTLPPTHPPTHTLGLCNMILGFPLVLLAHRLFSRFSSPSSTRRFALPCPALPEPTSSSGAEHQPQPLHAGAPRRSR